MAAGVQLMTIPVDVFNECDCCGHGSEMYFSLPAPRFVVVGHSRFTNGDGDEVNLSCVSLDGDILWQLRMPVDSFGVRKKPTHVRVDSIGNIYVAWNSPGHVVSNDTTNTKYLISAAAGPASTVGGVTKYDSNGNELWNCELPAAQNSPLGSFSPAVSVATIGGNCLDVSPLDGTIWTSTHIDTNGDIIHQIDPDDGTLIQSFGTNEMNATYPFGTGNIFANSGTNRRGIGCCTWLRVTESGNIWFNLAVGGGDAQGPYKCDASGNILRAYRHSFATGGGTPGQIFPCNTFLLMGEDSIVVCGGQVSLGIPGAPPPTSAFAHQVVRYDAAADTLIWARTVGDFSGKVSGTFSNNSWNTTNYRTYWVDGNLSRFVFSAGGTDLVQYVTSTGHNYRLFTLTGAGATNFASTVNDATSPFTDPRDHVPARGVVTVLDDYIFVAGQFVPANVTQGISAAMLVSINTSTGRPVWISDLSATTGFSYCIAAYDG